jgi:hypothetical protein
VNLPDQHNCRWALKNAFGPSPLDVVLELRSGRVYGIPQLFVPRHALGTSADPG